VDEIKELRLQVRNYKDLIEDLNKKRKELENEVTVKTKVIEKLNS